MKLGVNWHEKLKKAWSMRLMAMSALSNGALVVVALAPNLLPQTWTVVVWAAISAIFFNGLAAWSSLVYQKNLNGNK